jgi:hypothetical protein
VVGGAGMSGGWENGTEPWIRKNPKAICYFCGEPTAIVSWSDLKEDTGRVEVYCDNGKCDAREMTVLVTGDGGGASRRADVQALADIDTAPHLRGNFAITGSELMELQDGAVQRRLGVKP